MNWQNVSVEDECPCCLNPYDIDENIAYMPCFHATCVKCHLQCRSCPLCRHAIDQNIKPAIYGIISQVINRIKYGSNNNIDVTNYIIYLTVLERYI